VAKYSPSGSLLWVKAFGGTQTDSGRAVAVDANGNVLFAARFGSPSIVIGNSTLNNGAGSGDFVLVKLAAGDGSVMWARAGEVRGPIHRAAWRLTDPGIYW